MDCGDSYNTTGNKCHQDYSERDTVSDLGLDNQNRTKTHIEDVEHTQCTEECHIGVFESSLPTD
jgi:hypothetical protein